MRRIPTCTLLLLLASPFANRDSRISGQSLPARADSVFAAYAGPGVPGCSVGVDSVGQPIYRGAYGTADLEFGDPIRDTTILEAGSVSKQVTAAAVLLLATRGVLSLDDTLQQWFPEIPAYAEPITIRELMLHTSGLRDWGSVAALGGWPRGSRAYTQADVLAILARQRGLNHPPGTAFSYTNSGYNLLAMLVERATTIPFAEFTRIEFFAPLGMTRTSWRDDFTRIVPGRAQAYAPRGDGWRLDMPFENAHGNGGLLTTVGDLLRWTNALRTGWIGHPDVSRLMLAPGRFANGSLIPYGGGLFLNPLRGVPAVWHSGATAGYRSVLASFPREGLSVAILCNRADANPTALAEALLADRVPFAPVPETRPAPSPPPVSVDSAALASVVGVWHSDEAAGTITIRATHDGLRAGRRPGESSPLTPTGPDRFLAPGGVELHFERDTAGRPVRLLVSQSRALNVLFLPVP